MVAGRCRFHSGCVSRRIGSSTEPTTRRTAPWFASRLKLASCVSCVRPRVNSCRCGLISLASPSATIFKALLGRGCCNAFASSHGASRHAFPAWRRRIRAPIQEVVTSCLGGVVSGDSVLTPGSRPLAAMGQCGEPAHRHGGGRHLARVGKPSRRTLPPWICYVVPTIGFRPALCLRHRPAGPQKARSAAFSWFESYQAASASL